MTKARDLADLGPNTGLVHINTTSFSAVASQSINDVFSSSFKNYRVFLTVYGTSETSMEFRLRASGSDNTSTNYNRQRLRGFGTSVTAARNTNSNTWELGGISNSSNYRSCKDIIFFSPYQSINTMAICSSISYFGGANGIEVRNHTAVHKVNSSYDGFTFFPGTGNITGEVIIFGIKE